MKKITAFILAAILVFSLGGCGKETLDKNSSKETLEVKDSLEILTTVWDSYDEEHKFPVSGGDFNNITDNAPGKFDVSNIENLRSALVVPEEAAGLIDDAASMLHMMNANTFTGGAYHLKDQANREQFTDALTDAVLNNQWLCGFPQEFILYGIGEEYVVSAFGNAEIIEYFKNQLTGQYPSAEMIAEESL